MSHADAHVLRRGRASQGRDAQGAYKAAPRWVLQAVSRAGSPGTRAFDAKLAKPLHLYFKIYK